MQISEQLNKQTKKNRITRISKYVSLWMSEFFIAIKQQNWELVLLTGSQQKGHFYHLEIMPVPSFGPENLLCRLLDVQRNPDVDTYFRHLPSVK